MKGAPLHQSLIVKTLNHTSNSYNLYHTTFNRIIFFNHRQNGTLFLATKPCNVNSKIMTPSMNEKLLKHLNQFGAQSKYQDCISKRLSYQILVVVFFSSLGLHCKQKNFTGGASKDNCTAEELDHIQVICLDIARQCTSLEICVQGFLQEDRFFRIFLAVAYATVFLKPEKFETEIRYHYIILRAIDSDIITNRGFI